MERRVLVGMVVLAAVGAAGLGCSTEKRRNNPYMNEMGRAESIGDTPLEVQEFVQNSYPGAEVDQVYEMRHMQNYHMRHFEIHLILEGGRKKVVDYNVFQKPTYTPKELKVDEASGAGTTPGAQPRGELEGKNK